MITTKLCKVCGEATAIVEDMCVMCGLGKMNVSYDGEDLLE